MDNQLNRGRTFVQFAFFKALPEWRRLSESEQMEGKDQFASIIDKYADEIVVRSYSLVGIRPDADLMIWRASQSTDKFQRMQAELLKTGLGKYLQTPYLYSAMTKRSQYIDDHEHPGQDGARLQVRPTDAKYLFVYPFLKTRAWFLLSKEERQKMMNGHIEVGSRYPSVKLNTTYSFGLDDQEWVVAFETDEPADFLDLVMELRSTAASAYTLRDTPIFTCVQMPIREALDLMG
jgi:chlorite dismutase